ncbi:MAG: tetratricopeptide repeat protein [Myxococcota bacterium]|nr:tetratricopeptide repeat protein [Myxococcota bacterium]
MKASLVDATRMGLLPPQAVTAAALFFVMIALTMLAAGCGAPPSIEDVKSLQQQRRFEESIEPLRRLLQEEGGRDNPEVLYLYGRALSTTGRHTPALWAFRKAMEDPLYKGRAAVEIAAGGLRSMNYPLAIEGANQAIEVDPEMPGAYAIRAMALINSRQDYDKALEDADRVLELKPEDSSGLVARALALLALERVEEAGEAIEIAAEHFELVDMGLGHDAGRYCAIRGKFAFEKGEPERAEEIYLECLERHPGHDVLVSEIVTLLDDKGEIDRSNEIIEAALDSNPRNQAIRVALARRFDVIGRADQAEALLGEATKFEQPKLAARAFWDLAAFQISHGKTEEGLASFEKTIEIRGERDPELLFAYGDALAVAGKVDEVLALAERMGSEPHKEMIRGRAYFEQGDYAEALEHFDQGLLLWPNNFVVRYLAGISAEEIGDFSRAIDEYRYSMRDGASGTDSRLRLARLYFAEEEYGQALTVLRHDYQKTPPEFEEALLELALMDRLGQTEGSVPGHLSHFAPSPEFRTRASLIFIEGARHRGGDAVAAEMILESSTLDLSLPENLPILKSLVLALLASNQPEFARSQLAETLEANPSSAGLRGLEGLVLAELGEASAAKLAYDRALELDAEEPMALEALADAHVQSGDIDSAVQIYERLAEIQPRDVSALLAAADALSEASRVDESAALLRAVLEREPYHSGAALRLARLEAEAGRAEAARILAVRAARFGGGPEAKDFLREQMALDAG